MIALPSSYVESAGNLPSEPESFPCWRSPVEGGLDRLRMHDGAAILVSYITRNIQNRRKRMRSYGPTAAEHPHFHEVAALYYAVQLLILLTVRPDGCDSRLLSPWQHRLVDVPCVMHSLKSHSGDLLGAHLIGPMAGLSLHTRQVLLFSIV